jgi:tetratricopeptide (TPR) repeat protein
MILTQCPVCAVALPALTAKQCSRCKTRYCGPACQKTHWEQGGHDKLCRKIRKGGGAEQFHADTKYTEAVTVAAEACTDDTKGQTCYICTQALHWKTKEGLVRGCSCRGTADFAHVSCLAEQAKILVAEAEENNLGYNALNARFARWHTCSLCEQQYHGVVACALGWACWKTYVGRPEKDWCRLGAINVLGNFLSTAKHHEDALSVREAELSTMRRIGADEDNILAALGNLAGVYQALGRNEEALSLKRDVYSGRMKLNGKENEKTLRVASNYGNTLVDMQRLEEAKALLRKTVPVARRVLGESHEMTFKMRWIYAIALYRDFGATLDDFREALTTLEDAGRTARRVLGGAHPITAGIERDLQMARAGLSARDSDVESMIRAFETMAPEVD